MNKIVQAEDILAEARNYVECIFMAAAGGALPTADANALQTVATAASNKLDEAIASLDEVSKINALREENEALRGGLAAAGLVHSAKPEKSKGENIFWSIRWQVSEVSCDLRNAMWRAPSGRRNRPVLRCASIYCATVS